MSRPDLTGYLGREVRVVIDRPLGSRHPRHADLVYPVNYGFLPGTVSGDGHPVDAYALGIGIPVSAAVGRVAGVVRREDDVEDRLIVAADGRPRTGAELAVSVEFHE